MPFIPELPGVLAEMLHGMEYDVVTMGDTKDDVICFKKGYEVCFLKTGKLNPDAYRERDMLLWLKGKLPVPSALHWHETAEDFFLLTSCVAGEMACTKRGLAYGENEVQEVYRATAN